MHYHPDRNCAAYAPDNNRSRLALLEKLDNDRTQPRSAQRTAEIRRLRNHLSATTPTGQHRRPATLTTTPYAH